MAHSAHIHVLLEYLENGRRRFRGHTGSGNSRRRIEFVGTQGKLEITRSGYTFTPVEGSPVKEQGDRGRRHDGRSFVCHRLRQSRKRPNGDVLVGHRSALASHLGNIAYLERRRIELDLVREEVRPE
jgi:hypothetical protein